MTPPAFRLRQRRQAASLVRGLVCLMVVAAMAACSSRAPSPSVGRETSGPSSAKTRPYKVLGRWYYPLENARGFEETGLASWYGKKFHGRKTASGETYDMYGVSAAHKTLPLGTYVRVYHLQNGRSLDVRVNDRGPFVRGRIIDLSYGAARKLGIVGPGTAPVRIVALGAPVAPSGGGTKTEYVPLDYYSGNFTYQIGAFRDRGNAERLRARLESKYTNTHITVYDSPSGVFYRVRVGRFGSLDQARAHESILIEDGFRNSFIVAE